MATRAVGEAESAAVWVTVEELSPWKGNPRKNDEAVSKVADSIKRFGFGAPLLARTEDRQIIAGHTRLRAAQALGMREVPVRFLDLSLDDARLLALADNRLGEIAEWDEDRLATILNELKTGNADLSTSGFDPGEIDRLLTDLESRRLEDLGEDLVPEPPDAPDSRPGMVYELGPHHLVCGDCTDPKVLESILRERKADLLFTDPPYGVSYQSHMSEEGRVSRFPRIENDDLSAEAHGVFLRGALQAGAKHLRPGSAFYLFHGNQRPGLATASELALLSNGFCIASCIVWVKPSATMGWQDYRNQYEPILYGWKLGADRRRIEDRSETNVWEIPRDAAILYEHPTQKPVELSMRAMRNSTLLGETVLDLFAGSGSTLIGAERCGRKAVLVEKDPAYCDVIRQRWESFAAKVSR